MIRAEIMFNLAVGQRRFGWAEDHYIVGAGDLRAAINHLGTLAAARSQLLGAGVGINYLRVSDEGKLRDTQILPGLQFGNQLRVQKNGIFRVEPLVAERIDFTFGNESRSPGDTPVPHGNLLEPEAAVFLSPKLTGKEAGAALATNQAGQDFISQKIIAFVGGAKLAEAAANAGILPLYVGPPRPTGNPGLYNANLAQGIAATDLGSLIADQPSTGLLLRLEGGRNFTARRPHLIRGLPDALVVSDVNAPFSRGTPLEQSMLNALASYASVLLNGRYGMKTIVQGNANPERSIAGWTVGGTPTVVQANIPLLDGQAGDKVRIRGVRIRSIGQEEMTFGATLSIHSRTGDLYTFVPNAVKTPFVASLALGRELLRAGKALLVKYDVQPYTGFTVRRWGAKKAGSGFDAPKVGGKKKRKAVRRK